MNKGTVSGDKEHLMMNTATHIIFHLCDYNKHDL